MEGAFWRCRLEVLKRLCWKNSKQSRKNPSMKKRKEAWQKIMAKCINIKAQENYFEGEKL